jgi:flavin-binding protein dodecin
MGPVSGLGRRGHAPYGGVFWRACREWSGSATGGNEVKIAKVIEISSESDVSFEDAIRNGVAKASESVHNIKGAWVKEQKVTVSDSQIVSYRVDLKLTFVMD